MRKVERSILAPAMVQSRVIPNGVDLALFHPAFRREARASLDIPQDSKVLLFVANDLRRNPWKDYSTMQAALAIVAERLRGKDVLFIALGQDAPPERIGQALVRFVPHQPDAAIVARFYQAADVYVHAARVDTFPNTVLEALACGTPVVATGVGGIPEQVKSLRLGTRSASHDVYGAEEPTGILVPPADPEGMAQRIITLLTNETIRCQLGTRAAADARQRFDLNLQVEAYLGWYRAICACYSRG